MTRIEECEKLLSEWEAAGNRAFKNKASRLGEVYVERVYGLKSALDIFKRPSNTRLKIDTNPKQAYRWVCEKCRGNTIKGKFVCDKCLALEKQ